MFCLKPTCPSNLVPRVGLQVPSKLMRIEADGEVHYWFGLPVLSPQQIAELLQFISEHSVEAYLGDVYSSDGYSSDENSLPPPQPLLVRQNAYIPEEFVISLKSLLYPYKRMSFRDVLIRLGLPLMEGDTTSSFGDLRSAVEKVCSFDAFVIHEHLSDSENSLLRWCFASLEWSIVKVSNLSPDSLAVYEGEFGEIPFTFN